ncbi:MAG: flagellar biosynthetic protein FliO [Granulosicoccus sp.]
MKIYCVCRQLIVATAVVPGLLQAADAERVVVSPMLTLGKLSLALVVVLGVFWLFARLMKQLQGTKGSGDSGLQIVGALAVGQRERLLVVQAGDEQIVLGVTAHQISKLHVLDTPVLVTGIATEEPGGDFRQKLKAALKRQVPA